jgi:type I restriction enzyme S subunit
MTARSTWPVVRLGDYVDLLAGFAFKSSGFTDNSEDVPLVKGDNVQQGYIDWGRAKRWPREASTALSKFRLASGDVVLAMDRPWVEAGLKLAWVKRSDPEALLVQRVSRLRGVNGLDTTFMRYVLCSQSFTNYIRPIVTGINVPHISPGQIRDFKFILPPLAAQRHIASILSAYDDLIENNTRRIAILEEMARRIYEEWFVRFRFPGHEQVKRVESELGLIPEGWKVVAASDAITINPKVRVPKEGLKPFVPMGSLSENSMLITGIEEREGNSGSKFQNGDTLFARITPCLENGKTGFVQFLPSHDAVAFGSTEFIVLRSRALCPEYVYALARSDEFRANAIKSMSGATGRQRVKEACFDAFLLAQPDAETLQSYREIAQPMFAMIRKLAAKNANLRATRDLLLPKLISGELDVSTLSEPTV